MRKLVGWIAIAAVTLIGGGMALAQEAGSQPVALRKVIVNFTEEVIEGHTWQPDIEPVNVRRRTKFESLVKVRTDFRAELLRSVSSI